MPVSPNLNPLMLCMKYEKWLNIFKTCGVHHLFCMKELFITFCRHCRKQGIVKAHFKKNLERY